MLRIFLFCLPITTMPAVAERLPLAVLVEVLRVLASAVMHDLFWVRG